MFLKILVFVLEHLHGIDFEDFSLQISYNSKGIDRFGHKKWFFENDLNEIVK